MDKKFKSLKQWVVITRPCRKINGFQLNPHENYAMYE